MITLKEFIAKTYWSCKVAVILANEPRRKGDMTLKQVKEWALFYGIADDLHSGDYDYLSAEVSGFGVINGRLVIEIEYDI